jgi:hypothetical protein
LKPQPNACGAIGKRAQGVDDRIERNLFLTVRGDEGYDWRSECVSAAENVQLGSAHESSSFPFDRPRLEARIPPQVRVKATDDCPACIEL